MTNSYVASGPEDLIALAPMVLGFEPTESVVLMTFGARDRSFHARADLPRRPREQDEVAAMLVRAVKTNQVRDCAVLLYAEDRAMAAAQGRKLNRRLRRAGCRVFDVLTVHEGRYFRPLHGDDKADKGTVFDLESHRFTAQRVLEGRVVHKSREDLMTTLLPDDFEEARQPGIDEAATEWLAKGYDPVAEQLWIRTVVSDALGEAPVEDDDLPRLLADLMEPDLTDTAWAMIARPEAPLHVEVWRDVVRRAPDTLMEGPAALLAFSAWMAGEGALAWCALDLCPSGTQPMADMVRHMLNAAIPPRMWPGMSAEELTALRKPAA